jgi:hypothetical protein
MARTIINNKQVFQSYVLTTAKYDFSPYEKRIMYRLIELAQKEIEGIKLKDNLRKIAPTNFGREITMPVSDILKDEQDKHYTIAKAAFRSLSEKHIEYEDDEVWSYTPIITAPEIKKNSGSVKFYVFDNIWRCLLDFTKGFKKYELITAMKFKSAYAMRFYELMSGQTKPLFVLLEGPDGLRERFYLQGKYEKVNDFRRKVIDVAKKELDESSPYSFVAKEEKAGKKLLAGLSSLYFMKTEKTLRCRNKRAWLKLQHGSSWKTTYMTTLNSPLTSSLMKSTKTRKPLSRDKTVFPILWGSWEN